MNEQHGVAANTRLEPESDMSDLMLSLLSTKPWVRLCSIIGFLSAISMIVTGTNILLDEGAGMRSLGGQYMALIVSIVCFVMAILYFLPSMFLFKYASAIGVAQASNSIQDITTALVYQKSFWKFSGIIMLIFFVMSVVFLGVKMFRWSM